MAVAKPLAYCDTAKITTVKSCIGQAPDEPKTWECAMTFAPTTFAPSGIFQKLCSKSDPGAGSSLKFWSKVI
jgi:hypothetical protein